MQVDDPPESPASAPATLLWHRAAGADPASVATAIASSGASGADASDPALALRIAQPAHRLMPLEPEASGLEVFSQDWRIRRRLVEDHAAIEQEFIVEVSGDIAPWGIARLCSGIAYAGRPARPCKVSWQNEIRLRFAIKDVRPGQLRAACVSVGLEPVAIRRIRIGRIPLGPMPVGHWRLLPADARF